MKKRIMKFIALVRAVFKPLSKAELREAAVIPSSERYSYRHTNKAKAVTDSEQESFLINRRAEFNNFIAKHTVK
jgi:hypothetical protein